MIHLDEGALVALRDREAIDRPAAEHLPGCATCAVALDETSHRARLIAENLEGLDEPVDLAAAKAAVRRRLDARRGGAQARTAWWRRHLGRAAAILLLTAGAASALPWSPVRHWWVGGERGPAPSPEAVDAPVEPQGSPLAGISVALPQGRIVVIVRGAEPGTVIEVAWVTRASASISAPAGSGFTYADGRAEVEAASGPIRVELPRDATFASLEVDGRVFVERSPEGVAVPGPATASTEAGIRFVIPDV